MKGRKRKNQGAELIFDSYKLNDADTNCKGKDFKGRVLLK